MNKFITLLLILSLITNFLKAGDTIPHRQIVSIWNDQSALFESGNTAAMLFLPAFRYNIGQAGYSRESGTFKGSLEPSSDTYYNSTFEGYQSVGKSRFYGQASYRYGRQKGKDYNSNYNPYRVKPYTLVDTLTGGEMEYESFYLKGAWAIPINQHYYLGTSTSYHMILANEDTDPRGQSTINQWIIEPSLIRRKNTSQWGMIFNYQYENEDLDIKAFAKDRIHHFYELNGLGQFHEYFEARSLYRLHKRHTGGIRLQYQDSHHFAEIGHTRFQETIKNGRKGDFASWRQIRHPFNVNGKQNSINYQYRTQLNQTTHHVGASFSSLSITGTERFQKLLSYKEGEHSYNVWETYAKLDKYYRDETNWQLSYKSFRMNSPTERLWKHQSSIALQQYREHLNDGVTRKINHDNLLIKSSYERNWFIGNTSLLVEPTISSRINLNKKQNHLAPTSFTTKIIQPDANWATTNYLNYQLQACLQWPPSNKAYRYFAKVDYSYVQALDTEHNMHRQNISFSLGIVW
jgi:hypothetical protein